MVKGPHAYAYPRGGLAGARKLMILRGAGAMPVRLHRPAHWKGYDYETCDTIDCHHYAQYSFTIQRP